MSELLPKPAVYMETYGCQMNVLDSELVQEQLQALGFGRAESPEEAGVVLMNTCSVRELSEHKVWSFLGRLGLQKKRRQDLIIGVLGCMAEREGPSIVARTPQVDLVCGPSNLGQLPLMLQNAMMQRGVQVALAGHTSRRSQTLDAALERNLEALDQSRATVGHQDSKRPSQAYVRITRGCNKFCAFCVVPYTRGPEMHRPPDHVVAEVRRLVAGGAKEVTLLGQTVNHYTFHDGGRTTSFADLLARVHDEVPELARLRFLTSYPRDFTDDALDVMAQSPRISRFLHIPAQSGSDRLLKKMNRGYTVEGYLGLLERARARMPDICIAGDMIAGYCSETAADHEASLQLLRTARYKSCFIFKYSPRSGTVAFKRHEDDVPDSVKKERNAELLAVQAQMSLQHHQARIGRRVEVLVEHVSRLKPALAQDVQLVAIGQRQNAHLAARTAAPEGMVRLIGRTAGDELLAFDGKEAWLGQFVDVQVTEATSVTLRGTCVSAAPAAEVA